MSRNTTLVRSTTIPSNVTTSPNLTKIQIFKRKLKMSSQRLLRPLNRNLRIRSNSTTQLNLTHILNQFKEVKLIGKSKGNLPVPGKIKLSTPLRTSRLRVKFTDLRSTSLKILSHIIFQLKVSTLSRIIPLKLRLQSKLLQSHPQHPKNG